MTIEWAAVSAISAGINIIMGVLLFMIKSSIDEREKRFNHLDVDISNLRGEISNIHEKLNEHDVRLAVIDQKYDSIIKLLSITDGTITKLSNTLEGCRLACNKTKF